MKEKIRVLPDFPTYSTPTPDNLEPGSIPSSPRVVFSPSLLCLAHRGVLSVPTRPTAYQRSTILISQRSQCLRRTLGISAHGLTAPREPSHYPARAMSKWSLYWDISWNPKNWEDSLNMFWNPPRLGKWIPATAPDLKTVRTFAKVARTKKDQIKVSYKTRKWTVCKAFNAVIKREQSDWDPQPPHPAKFAHVASRSGELARLRKACIWISASFACIWF